MSIGCKGLKSAITFGAVREITVVDSETGNRRVAFANGENSMGAPVHTVALSGGLGSAFVAVLAGKDAPTPPILLHTDTKFETEDTYVFMENVAAYLGLSVTYVANGRTPEQLFWEEHLLGNDLFPVCSHILKVAQCDKWILERQSEGFTPIMYLGILPSEPARMHRLKQRYQHMGMGPEIPVFFPLAAMDNPRLTSPAASALLEEITHLKGSRISNLSMGKWFESKGIPIPSAYKKGLGHNNCRGQCVRAGIHHWALMYRIDNPGYQEAMMREYRFAIEVIPLTKKGMGKPGLDAKGFPTTTFLKRKGKPLSLLEMAQMLDQGWTPGDRTVPEILPCICET